MNKEAIIEKVKKQTEDGKMACKQAQRIADEEGIPYKVMGTLLNELKIKIANCQLGCFP
jgi:hypothetical protein